MNVTSENLDNFLVPNETSIYLVPMLSFVHDNVLYGYTSPIQGTRYNLTAFGNPGISNPRQSFYSLTWDYRTYFRFFYDNSFVFRVSGGYSGGANPQRFFLGGTENWINRTFATGTIPINSPGDFAFLSPALPLRGYNYSEQIGSKYLLMNLELRLPVIRYLITGPLPFLFQNVLGTAFIDAGMAWDDNNNLRIFQKLENGSLFSDRLLVGMGFGLRAYFIFLWRFDWAWAYNFNRFSNAKFYVSMGFDF
jgi:outer membrane protein assembly factor BamA